MTFVRQHKLVLGCGYLGRRVAEAWVAQGHRVSAVTRSPSRALEFAHDGLLPIVADICDPETLHDFPRVDTVLFAVGYDRTSGKSQWDVYVQGLTNVLEQVGSRIQKFVYISSSSVYGQCCGEWVDETSECFPSQPGGVCCLTAEKLLPTYLENRAHAQFNVLRLSGIYGPSRLLTRIESLRAGEMIAGRSDSWLNLIHVDDAVSSVLACEERGVPGATYLVTDDRPIPRCEYYRTLAELIHAEVPKFNPDESARRGAGGLNKRCSNRRLRTELGVKLLYPTINEGLYHALMLPASPSKLPLPVADE